MRREGRPVVANAWLRVLMLCGTVVTLAACAGRAASSDSSDDALLTAADAAAALEMCCGDSAVGVGLRIAADYKEPSITTRSFTPEEFWSAVQPMAEYARFDVATMGQSLQGRPLRTITIGRGPVRVLVWSQMTGDESTGSMALADLVRWFANTRAEDRDDALRARLLSELTVVLLPILNPDAAEQHRRSKANVALAGGTAQLSTSEAGVLQSVRDKLQPDVGFVLLDQGARVRTSELDTPAAITLFTPLDNATGGAAAVGERARLIAATLAKSFLTELPGRVVRYDDTFTARVFGAVMEPSDMRTVLIESGIVAADPQNQRLRSLHVAALLSAFDALATGAYQGANPALYEQLPRTARDATPTRP